MSPGLSVIIVHYKTPDLLDLCVSSLFRYSDGVDLEVIVVNNDEDLSTRDRLIAKFPDLVWIEAGYNAGFSRANNMGIRKASRDYLLILNPDAEIKEGFLQKYLAFYIDIDRDGSL
jgi:GT2 family glycosyltransferase